MRAAAMAPWLCVLAATCCWAGGDARAAGRVPYGGSVSIPATSALGLTDPHAARTRTDRALASLGHCRLYRLDGAGDVRAELAAPGAQWRGRRLTLTLRPARFHGGAAVRSVDVVKSLERAGGRGVWGPLVAALDVRALGADTVVIDAPRGTARDELRALLARPELAILRGGRPGTGRGCGPWQVTGRRDGDRRMQAFLGHPEGRPWLDGVDVKRVAGHAAEASAFVYGDVDLAFADGLRSRRAGRSVEGGAGSVWALVHPRWRGEGGRTWRRTLAALARRGGLARFVEARARTASGPWPEVIAPTRAGYVAPSGASSPRAALTIAFPEGDRELGDLARALRDTLASLARGRVRSVGVAGLDAASARDAGAPDWDLALVRHDWAALTPAQGAWEAATLAGLDGLTPQAVLTRGHRRWAERVAREASLLAILHVERPVLVRGEIVIEGAAGGLPALDGAYVPR